MRALRLLLLLACLAAHPAVAPLVAEEAPGAGGLPEDEVAPVLAAAERFWKAFEAADEAQQRAIAATRTLDIVRVLGVLLTEHLRAVARDADTAARRMACAQALVRLAQGNPAAKGADAVLATRLAWTPEDVQRETRMRAAADAIEGLDQKGDVEGLLAQLESVRPDLAAARGSLLACFLQQDIGLLAWRLGRRGEALAAMRASQALAAALPWPGGQLRALRYVYSVVAEGGDLDELMRVGREAQAVALEAGWVERALLAGLQTTTHLRIGARYAEALETARALQALARAHGLPKGAAQAVLAEAKTHAVLGERTRALELVQRALGDPALADDAPLQVEALTVQAYVLSQGDRFADALATVERALALLEGKDEPGLAAHVWTSKGIYHRRLGQLDQALACQQRAVALAERDGGTSLLGTALGNLGLVQKQLGDRGYRATLQRALEVKRRGGDQLGMLETALNLANDLVAQPESRAQGFRLLDQVLAGLEKARALPQVAATLTALANAHLLAGAPGTAAQAAARALDVLRSVDDRGLRLALAQEAHAAALTALQQPAPALEAALTAVRARRALAAGLGEEDASGLVQSARRSSDLAVGCALALAAAQPAEAAAGAFEAIEAGRATLLAAGVLNAEALLAAQLPPALVAAESAGRSRVTGARARLVAASSRPTPDAALLASARKDLDDAWTTYADSVARIQREARRVAGVVFPQPLGLPELQRRLPPGTAYLAYQLGTPRSIALVVRREGAQLVALPTGADLAERIEAYVGLASAPDSDESAPAAALYDALLRPLEAHLQGATRLVVAPDGALTFLPFEALLRRDDAAAQRVVERWEVAYVPSATVLASLGEEQGSAPGRGFVGLGDPAYGSSPGGPALVPLPRSGEEVRAIGGLFPAGERTLLLGAQARSERLLASLPKPPKRLRALHVACHAFVDAERPRLSTLALAQGDTLDLDAIYRLRVPADLCVLSACATARGHWLQGEGVLGFVRGFFFAGVPRVIVSNWVVEDQSARTLMEALYAGMLKQKQGPAAALRAAKLQALKSGGAGAHPSSWAAFVLWGLPDGRE